MGALFDAIRRSAERHDTAPALTFVGGRPEPYSFGELLHHANALAEGLEALELQADAPIGILLRTQEDQALHYLAALAAGLVPAILTPPNPKLNREYYAATMAEVLVRSRFSALITDVPGVSPPCPVLSPYEFACTTRTGASRSRHDGRLDAAFLQFSSGTTGIKRGVLVTDEAALAQIATYGDAIGLDGDDTIVSWLPLYHDMGFIACLNMPLVRGTHTVMIDPIEWVSRPGLFLRQASTHRATVAWNPNFAYAFMAQRVPDRELVDVDLSSFRGLVNCSEPVTHASQEQFSRRFGRVGLRDGVFWGCYAMAETTFALTHGTPSDESHLDPVGPDGVDAGPGMFVSTGRPLPGVELRLVSDSDDVVSDRRLGEVQVRSPFTFAGYFGDSKSTTEAFGDGWYRTGDLGYTVGDALFVLDRKKDVMIVGGVNVFPRDIEEVVSSVDGVVSGRSSAFAYFDDRLQTQRIVVLFECVHEERELVQAVVMEVRQRVLAAFQIANFEVHALQPGWLVKSSAGKISRSQNRVKWLGEGAS